MTRELAIYLSGSVQKGPADQRGSFWTSSDLDVIEAELSEYAVIFLNPSDRNDDLSDFLGTLGRDLLQVAVADVVIVDARDRRGIGVGAEMAVADCLKIPVVSICPPDSHYYKLGFEFFGQQLDEWVHPFVHGFSEQRVDDVQMACGWIRHNLGAQPAPMAIRATERVSAAIAHYVAAQLDRDTPMRVMIEGSPTLRQRVDLWRSV
jgi:hypothetical protein